MDHPYEQLTPDLVIDAVESLGMISDQRIFPLNSYENRVYQIGIEDATPLIAKFYRPERWTDAAIQEEHQFTLDLLDQDISVVAPMVFDGQTLFEFKGYRFSLFPRQGGYAPEIEVPDTLFRIGRNVGRIHLMGSSKTFEHRRSLNIETWANDSQAFLLENEFIPLSLCTAYETLTRDIIDKINRLWQSNSFDTIRLHGDCHIGNILWRDDLAHFVDFDDCINGPAIQDIWLLLSGDRHAQTGQLIEFVEGYEEFFPFDPRQLQLIETLRTLRMMHYAAWLARRWQDPAFPMHFPWFNTERYWSSHVLELREQFALLDEPALKLAP
ncbi:MAG: serine/threonine protein kinase [Oleiphilus sp.]|nr:MAG: serine/threonine protein kinase [Oleiphilus sp.]